MKRIRYLLLAVAVALTAASWGQSIAEREYWIDGDIANRLTLGESVASIDISALDYGLHSFTMRVKDNEGVWSSPVTQYFVIPRPNQAAASSIAAREYWIDGDIANRQTLDASVATIDISSLPIGAHRLTVRVKDDEGVWSSPVTQYFLIPSDQEDAESTIVRCLYWFDNDTDNCQTADVEGDNGTVTIDVSKLTAGEHTIYWRVGDSKGAWSEKVSGSLFRYTVPASGVGTFSAATAMALPEGLTPHYTTTMKQSGSRLYVNVEDISGNIVPAETGILLKGEGEASFTLLPSTDEATAHDNNTLVAVVESAHIDQTSGDYTNFMLKDGKFIKIAEAEGSIKMPANRAYLPVESTVINGSAKSIVLLWTDEEMATGIGKVATDEGTEAPAYNMNGQRVGRSYKGIVIVNGKKILKK